MKRKILLSVVLAMICMLAFSQELGSMKDGRFEVFHEEVESMASFRADEDVLRTRALFHVPDRLIPQLRHYFVNMERQNICQDYWFADSLKRRVLNKLAIERIYQDSIDILLIPYNGNRISGENISYALYLSKKIQLTDEQYTQLMSKALDMSRRIRKNRVLNVWDEEMNVLQQVLDKKQLTLMFYKKNEPIVSGKIKEGWSRLQNEGLTEQLDSLKDIKQARHYYNESEKMKAIFRYKPSIRKKCLAEINKRKPLMVKLLDALDKKERMNKNEIESVGNEFVW